MRRSNTKLYHRCILLLICIYILFHIVEKDKRYAINIVSAGWMIVRLLTPNQIIKL